MFLAISNTSEHQRSALNKFCKNLSALILVFGTVFFLGISCSDDTPTGTDTDFSDNGITEESAKQAVLDFLIRLGAFPDSNSKQAALIGISFEEDQQDAIPPVSDDYLVSEATESGNIEITMQLDSEGNIVPSLEWRNENNGYCLEKGKRFKTPVWNLTVTLYPESERVQVNLIDIGSGQIEASGNESIPGDSWVDDGISEAWEAAGIPEIQKADSPCGAKIELTLVFDSEMTATIASGEEVTRVRAKIPLENSSDMEVFQGTSTLVLKDFPEPNPPAPPGGSISCNTSTTSGTISAKVTIPGGNFDSIAIDDLEGMIDVSIRILEEESPILTTVCDVTTPQGSGQQTLEDDMIWYRWFHVLNHSQDPDAPNSYFYESFWDPMENEPFGLAKREVVQSETFTDEGESITLSEDTRLEIWTKELQPLQIYSLNE